LNWYGLVAEGVVLCKDGSLLAGWYMDGVDTESLDIEQASAKTETLARAMKEFRTGDAFWVDLARRPLRTYKSSEKDFDAPVLQLLEAEREEYFKTNGDENFANRITLVYQWQPPAPAGRLDAALAAFTEHCRAVENRFGSLYSMRRMGLRTEIDNHHGIEVQRDELVGRLASGLSGRFRRMNVPKAPIYLDVMFNPDWDHPHPGRLPMVSGRPAAFIAIDGYPAVSTPEMLSLLEEGAFEYQWTTRFMPLSGGRARGEVQKRARAWGQTKTSVRSQISRGGNGLTNEFTESMQHEAESALADIEEGELRYGFFNSTVSIFGEIGDSEAAVRAIATALVEALGEVGFSARLETYNALECFLSIQPGHRKENVRRGLVSTLNFADLIPISTIWSGEPANPCDKFPARSPALLRARSLSGEPYFFNLHSGDVGHTLMFGPTGAGKSVFLSMIASNFLNRNNS
jgi:type IV secretion system protein TrbE